MEWEIIRDDARLEALSAEWASLWSASAERAVNLHPAWVIGWWRTIGGGGELMVAVGREGAEVACVAPLYLTPPQGGSLRVRELRLIGDGVVGARAAVLTRSGSPALLESLASELAGLPVWEALDLALTDEEQLETLARRWSSLGRKVESVATLGRPQAPLDAAGRSWLAARATEAFDTGDELRSKAGAELGGSLHELARLLRTGSPRRTAEPAFLRFVELVAPDLVAAGAARLLAVERGERTMAMSLVLVDGTRWIELASAAAPEVSAMAFTRAVIDRAVLEGAELFEFSDEEHPLASARAEGARLRVDGAGGLIQRSYASLVRRAGAVADAAVRAPREQIVGLGDRIQRLRGAAPEAARRAVARVATFSRLHLYRGELFVRGGPPSATATLRLISQADFDARPDRAAIVARLGLAPDYCRQKWQRGDMVVLAELPGDNGTGSRAAGILWCAKAPVFVPDIGRDVRPLAGECYIHDVYVTPEARGHNIAPAMLDFLARSLRERDIYRAWALIERSNTASTRAFEKAGYASVADVIFAKMGLASKLLVRPPDPEARAFLGFGKVIRPR